MKRLTIALFILIPASASFAQKPSFTLEQVMSSPFPSNLTAAAKANRVAWVFNSRGERNVWMADAPEFTGRQVTHYQGDDGQDIFTLKLTPDGKTVVYARGSEVNGEGHVANPVSEIKEPKQQVWAADVETGKPRLIGDMGCDDDCEDIQVSPDGQWVVWVGAKHHLWIANVSDGKPARQLTELRGQESEPQWSPDAKRIAFTSGRRNHSFIAILDLGQDGSAQHVRYVAPGYDRDSAPRWSPDGKQLVFLRSGGTENHLPLIPRRPRPWAIWLANATGDAKELWHSGKEMNDSLPPRAAESLKFAEDGKIVFCSERDGWNHLYVLSLNNGDVRQLTPHWQGAQEFEVEDVELSPDKRQVLYSSNLDDPERRHISVDGLAGYEMDKQVFRQSPPAKRSVIEWRPLMLADGKTIICLGSSATSPAMPYLITQKGREMIAANALPKDFPSAQLVEPQTVTFRSEDGVEVHGQLFTPRGRKDPGPALIFVHGGPIRQMLPGFHYMYYYHNSYAENQYLASLGYVVLSVNYRLGIMYGREFREAANGGWRGSSEYKDVVAGAKYLQGLPTVDRKRIGIWGGSYGGLLTALALSRNSDIFAAGVDFHGVHDWSVFLSRFEMGTELAPDRTDAGKLAFNSSPVASVAGWKSPVLLIHGDDDRNVPFAQTVDLVQRLRRQNVEFEQLVFPDEIHDLLLWKSWVRAYKATGEFFDRKMR